MPILPKMGGAWSNAHPSCKVDGVWKNVVKAYAKMDDSWKLVYKQGGDTPSVAGYGFTYNKTLGSDPDACLTYCGLAEGFTPVIGGNGDANEGSWANNEIFNAIKPCVLDGSTGEVVGYLKKTLMSQYENGENAFYEMVDTAYDTMVEFPKIYQKFEGIGTDNVSRIISLTPGDGFTVHPAFIVDGVEKDKIYIGRYLGYVNESKLYSKSSCAPTCSITRANFRTYAKSRGSAYGMLSYHDWDLVNTLYLLACKDFHSQLCIGSGISSGSAVNTGGTDNVSWFTGYVSYVKQISIFGIEDWWGNRAVMLDDISTFSGSVYVGTNSVPTDVHNDGSKTLIASDQTGTGVPKQVRATAEAFYLGEPGTYAWSTTAGTCDYQFGGSGNYAPIVGGSSSNSNGGGAFCFMLSYTVAQATAEATTRLTYKP